LEGKQIRSCDVVMDPLRDPIEVGKTPESKGEEFLRSRGSFPRCKTPHLPCRLAAWCLKPTQSDTAWPAKHAVRLVRKLAVCGIPDIPHDYGEGVQDGLIILVRQSDARLDFILTRAADVVGDASRL